MRQLWRVIRWQFEEIEEQLARKGEHEPGESAMKAEREIGKLAEWSLSWQSAMRHKQTFVMRKNCLSIAATCTTVTVQLICDEVYCS